MSRPPSISSVKSATEGSTALGGTTPSEIPQKDTVQPKLSKFSESEQKLSNPRTVALLISVFLSMLLVAVDRTIVSTVMTKTLIEVDLANRLLLGHPEHHRRVQLPA